MPPRRSRRVTPAARRRGNPSPRPSSRVGQGSEHDDTDARTALASVHTPVHPATTPAITKDQTGRHPAVEFLSAATVCATTNVPSTNRRNRRIVSGKWWRRSQHQRVAFMSLLSCASGGVVRRCSTFTATAAAASGTRCFGAAPDEIGLIGGGARPGPIRVPLVRGAISSSAHNDRRWKHGQPSAAVGCGQSAT